MSKMKTITKEFWVSDAGVSDLKNNEIPSFRMYIFTKENQYLKHKIKISFEIPEKQVTISESDFDEILKTTGFTTVVSDSLKQKLFGYRG